MLLLRTKELDDNYKPAFYVKHFKFKFNVANTKLQLEENLYSILEALNQDSMDKALEVLEEHLIPILRLNKTKIANHEHKGETGIIIEKCYHLYKKLQHTRKNYPNDDNRLDKDLEEYQKATPTMTIVSIRTWKNTKKLRITLIRTPVNYMKVDTAASFKIVMNVSCGKR